jgi:hypothetical protein
MKFPCEFCGTAYHGSTSFRGIHKNDVLQLKAHEKTALDKDSVPQIFPEYYLVKLKPLPTEVGRFVI